MLTITVPLGIFIFLPLLGIPISIIFWKTYEYIAILRIHHEEAQAEKTVKKCEKDLQEMKKNYDVMQSEIKNAIEAYNELADLLGFKKK